MIDYTLPLEELPDPLPIEPLTKPFDVTITPPGSKSITCRAYVLAALAEGESKIIRPLRADDTDRLLESLCTLGAEARWAPGTDGEDVYITGVNGRFPRGGEVNLGDGGTPARFMIAVACLAEQPVIVDGSKRMRERPVSEGVDMLRQLGAKIEYVEQEGCLPVRVTPNSELKAGKVEVGATASSQFISAILLVGPFLAPGDGLFGGPLRLQYRSEPTSSSYIELTRGVLREWGATVGSEPNVKSDYIAKDRIKTKRLVGREYQIEPDASSATYWAAAAAMQAGNRADIGGISSDVQPDAAMFGALDRLGVIVCGDESSILIEGTGGLRARDRECDAFDMGLMPDATMSLAICAAVQPYPIRLTGLHTLRVKETDRIAALANELTKIGCTIETTDDSITIDPSTRHDKPVVIETYNDHRMAMAFGVLGLARPGISIKDPGVVNKSYPTFWRDFARLYE